MFFNAPESSDPAPQVRFDHDVQFLQSVIDKLLDVDEAGIKVTQVTRIGKREGELNRPLRVTFVDEATPRLVLSRLWRLKGMRVNVRPDMEPADRERLKSAVIELKRRTEAGETNLRIVNFRVVTKKDRVNRSVTLRARPAVALAVSE